MLVHNAEITGSLKINNVPFNSGSFSGSFRGDGSQLTGVTGASTASYVEYSNVGNKPALVSGSSQITYSELSGIPSGIVSGSSQVSFNGIVDKPTLVSGSSQVTYGGLSGIPAGIVSGSAQVAALGFATTGSNTFQANQTITGSLFITQNLVVAGSSSIQYISSSVVDIADNIITVNAFNPGVRFGGLAVIDSGSSPQVSGSLLFDSIKDQWIFIHETPGTVTSSVLLMGPETYNDLGNESYISSNRLPKGSGVEHLRDSNITDTGTVVSINSNTQVTGSFTVTTGSAVELQVTNLGVNIGSALTDSHIISGSVRINPSGLFVSGSGVVGIGTTSPLGLLHITPESVTGTRVDGLRLSKPITNAANYLAFQQGANGWRMGINYNDGAYPLVFLYGDSTPTATSPGSEFMRINASGNVGIGTATPSSKLTLTNGSNFAHINGGGSSTVPFLGILNSADYTAATYGWGFFDNGANGNLDLKRYNGSSTAIDAVTFQRSSGNVGIGTNNPGRALEIYAAGSATAQLKIGDASTSKGYLGVFSNAVYINAGGTYNGSWSTDGSNGIAGIVLETSNGGSAIAFGTAASNTSPSERMRITAGGNIGINTNSPTTYSLAGRHMELFGGGDYSFFHNNTTTVKSFYAINEALLLAALFTFSNHPLTLGTNNTERMRITSGGNIDISGGSVRTNGGTFRLADSGGTTVGGYFLRKASWLGTGTDHTPSIAAEGGYGINFYTNGQTAERMIITSGGNVLINTTSDNSAKLNVNGTTFTQILTQSVPLHGVKVLSYGPVSSATIDLPTEFPLMLLTAGNVWGVFGKYCGFDAGGVEVREFVICRNSGGSWASANYGPQSQTNASLQSVTGSGTTITVNVDSGSYFIIELTVFVR
jgi:hypothetical protein